MKALVFCVACIALLGFVSPAYMKAKHHKPEKYHIISHKHHYTTHKTSVGEPGTLKNTILHNASNKQNTFQEKRVNTVLNNGTGISKETSNTTNQQGPQSRSTGQATGRAILVHNANDGVGHIVKGSTGGHAPVIVINSDATGDKGGALDPFSQDCLDAHNNYRAKHGVPPLMWSHDLADGAQSWADQLASTDSLQHDQVAIHNHKIGENLAYFQPAVPKCEGAMVDNCVNCREMIQRWYDEVKNYDFDKGGPKAMTTPYKHFTQLIWANTAEIGVGTAVSKRYGFITVARYRPTGNNGGIAEFIDNVPPEGGPLPTMTPREDSASPAASVSTLDSPLDSPVVSKTTNRSESTTTTIDVKEVSSTDTSAHNDTSSATSANLISTKSTDVIAPSENGAKTENQSTASEPIKKGPRGKSGFVHTLTANDGSKAQVYLSKNGAHAGIVFRDEISRAPVEEEESTASKRTIYVL